MGASANIHLISQEMAEKGRVLDDETAKLRADAKDLLSETQRLADEHVANARRHAEQMLANATVQAEQLEQQADQAEEDAKHWKRLSAAERKRAKLPALPDPLPTPAAQTQPDGQPSAWTGPDGRVWDLAIPYIDPSGATWRWAGRFEPDGNGVWPVMTRDDFQDAQLPLPKCPPLNPAAGPELSGDLRVATGDPETAAMPAIGAQGTSR